MKLAARAGTIGLGAWLLVMGCGQADESPDDSGDSGEAGEGETGEEPALGDDCETTELLLAAPTTLRGSLRHATASSFEPGCAIDGPTVFARLRIDARVDLTMRAEGQGFAPRVAINRPGCVSVVDDPARAIGCAGELPYSVFDIGPDVELLVAVGIGADDPALALDPPAEGEDDPLDFELSFELRAVLEEGRRCGVEFGRCEAGTVCLPVNEGGYETDRCVRPPADSCVDPGELELPPPGELLELEIPPDEPHSDAHEHACTGWRRPDRVDRLLLPANLGPETWLRVRADDPRVGLALRGSDCAPEHALACAAAGAPSQTELSWGAGQLAELAANAEGPLLFVELPRQDVDGEPVDTITLSLELLEPAP